MSEKEMLDQICLFLLKSNMTLYTEIPFMSRVIDLVLVEEKTTTTMELKLNNWRKGIEQLKEQSIASDYCYLCLPKNKISASLLDKIIEELSFHGFGLHLWDDISNSLITPVVAKRSGYKSQFAYQRLRDNLLNYESN